MHLNSDVFDTTVPEICEKTPRENNLLLPCYDILLQCFQAKKSIFIAKMSYEIEVLFSVKRAISEIFDNVSDMAEFDSGWLLRNVLIATKRDNALPTLR